MTSTSTASLSAARPGVVVLERTDVAGPSYRDPERRIHVVATRATVKYGVRADGTVALWSTQANHRQGLPHWGSPKTFARWSTDGVQHISAKPGEPWKVSTYDTERRARSGKWARRTVFAETDLHSLGLGDLRDRARDLLPPRPSMWTYYPLLGHYLTREDSDRQTGQYGDPVQWAPAAVRRTFAGATTAQDLTRRLFGVTRYRRDLVKALAQTSLPNLVLAWQFRGLVPVDWLVEIMRERPVAGTVVPAITRPHLRRLDQQSLRNLIRDRGFDPSRYLVDIARYRPVPDLPRVRSWQDLHDVLVQHTLLYADAYETTRSGKQRPRKPITLPDYAESLIGPTPGGLTVEIATHEDDLWAWGQAMRHCISSYGRELRSGRALLGAVRDRDGVLRGNFEVQVGRREPETRGAVPGPPIRTLVQLLGHHNTLLPAAFRAEVTTWLEAHGVTVPETYWGSEVVDGYVEAA